MDSLPSPVDSLPSDVERRWILRLLNREPEAWNQFVEQFREPVQSAIRHTATRWSTRLRASDVDDFATEVFSAAYCALDRFRVECSLTTWLVSIARHVVNRELTRACHTRAVRHDLSETTSLDRSTQPLDNLLRNEDRQRVERALERLPELPRQVVQLHYLHSLDYREISLRIGISINSVGPALARGRDLLRAILKKNADSGELRTLQALVVRRQRIRPSRSSHAAPP